MKRVETPVASGDLLLDRLEALSVRLLDALTPEKLAEASPQELLLLLDYLEAYHVHTPVNRPDSSRACARSRRRRVGR